jgi:hypothetical protein
MKSWFLPNPITFLKYDRKMMGSGRTVWMAPGHLLRFVRRYSPLTDLRELESPDHLVHISELVWTLNEISDICHGRLQNGERQQARDYLEEWRNVLCNLSIWPVKCLRRAMKFEVMSFGIKAQATEQTRVRRVVGSDRDVSPKVTQLITISVIFYSTRGNSSRFRREIDAQFFLFKSRIKQFVHSHGSAGRPDPELCNAVGI